MLEESVTQLTIITSPDFAVGKIMPYSARSAIPNKEYWTNVLARTNFQITGRMSSTSAAK